MSPAKAGLSILGALTVAEALLKTEKLTALESDKGQHPGKDGHIGPLEDRPLPRIRFPADDGVRTDALKGQHVKLDNRDAY